ncbi:MAG: DUF6588 family protein [bacterium]
MKTVRLICVLLLTIYAHRADAQVDNLLAKYGGTNSEGFIQPLADAFAANLNSGLFQNGTVPLGGFHFRIGAVIMGAPVSDSRKTFTAKTDGFFSPPTTVQAPTIFGSTKGVSVNGDGGTVYVFPGGLDVKLLAIAVPQLSVGSIYGTEVLVRFFQAKLGTSFGTLKLFGFGARHNLNQYLKLKNVPLDFAAGIYYQHFELGSILSANATLISTQASWKTSVLDVYGGLGFEFSSMNVEYNGGSGQVTTSVKAANTVRLTFGAAVTLVFFRLYADYNLASQSTFAVGLNFGM